MKFRSFDAGLFFDWHTAPTPQYIIYLDGEVEIITSGNEKAILKAGEVLFANDTTGKGHTTRTLKPGKAIIVTTKNTAH